MAAQAERADVVEVAFTAAFGDRQDVVGVPQASAMEASDSPMLEQIAAIRSARMAQGAQGGDRIHAAGGAHAAIAQEDLIAEISGLRSQLPFVHAIFGAEGEAASEDLERAPAAEPAAVRAAGNGLSIHPSAAHDAQGAHLPGCNRGWLLISQHID